MNKAMLFARAWYYFRLGFSTYLSFIYSYITTVIAAYYLVIKNIPALQTIFPDFLSFVSIMTLGSIVASVLIGHLHLKVTNFAIAEQDLATESNPYTHKLPHSGVARDVFYPSMSVLLGLVKKLAEGNGFLTEQERIQIDEIQSGYDKLFKGGYVGQPKRRGV